MSRDNVTYGNGIYREVGAIGEIFEENDLQVIDVVCSGRQSREAEKHGNRRYRNLNPKCEPQLGKRGIYQGLRGQRDLPNRELALLWVLNLSDGRHTLLDIAERAHMALDTIHDAAQALVKHDLLQRADQLDDD